MSSRKKEKIVLLSKYAVYEEQEASGLLDSLGIETPLRKTPLVSPLLFYRY